MHQQQTEKRRLVTTREFLREFSDLTKKNVHTHYTIMRYGKPIGLFTPYVGHDACPLAPGQKQKKRVTLAELEGLRFHSGEKNLSTCIDEIAYGISR